jgi:hypothetical protein
LMRVYPHRVFVRRFPMRSESFPGINVPLGRPNEPAEPQSSGVPAFF